LKQAPAHGGLGQNAMGQIGVLRVLGHRDDLGGFLRQGFVKGFRGAWPAILEIAPASDSLLPAGNTTVLDDEDRTRPPPRHAVLQGGIDHREDLHFDFKLEPFSGYLLRSLTQHRCDFFIP